MVQALNVIALNNPGLAVEIVDGAMSPGEAKALHAGGADSVCQRCVAPCWAEFARRAPCVAEERFGTDAAGDVTRGGEA